MKSLNIFNNILPAVDTVWIFSPVRIKPLLQVEVIQKTCTAGKIIISNLSISTGYVEHLKRTLKKKKKVLVSKVYFHVLLSEEVDQGPVDLYREEAINKVEVPYSNKSNIHQTLINNKKCAA